MKKAILFLVTLSVIGIATPTFAADNRRADNKRAGSGHTVTGETSSMGSGGSRIGFGFATYGATGAGIAQAHALSFWMDFNSQLSLQPFVGITSSSPFNFGVGAILRYTVKGNQADGFHLGGGFNLGTTAPGSTFFLNIFPEVGFHFSLGDRLSNIQLSFDGGPMFAITPSPFQFQLAPTGIVGGASIHYFF